MAEIKHVGQMKGNGNKVAVVYRTVPGDSKSAVVIQTSKIDYVTELIGSSFKITNPQASSSCGCGTSFSI